MKDRGCLADIAFEVREGFVPDGDSEVLPYLGLEHIEPNSLIITSVGASSDVVSSKYKFTSKDVLFGKMRPYFRKVAKPSFNGVCSTEISVIRAKEEEDTNFIFYFVANQEFIDYATTNSKGDRPRTKWEQFSKFESFVPPPDVRRKIGHVLSGYDALIENNLKRIALLEKSTRLMYEEWFVRLRFPGYEHTKFIEGVPVYWEEKKAYDIMEIMSGGTPKTSVAHYYDGEIPFYTPKDSKDEVYVLDTLKNLTEEGLKNCNSKLYPKDTLFITARGTVGNLNLAQSPMAMNQSCYALKGRPPVSQKYLYCAMQAAVEYFKKTAGGAVFDAIVVDTFKLIPFILPEATIIQLFEESVEPLFAQIENLLLQNQKLKQARDILLPRLINGEIAV